MIYLVNSAELITEFLSPPIGAALMEKNVWLAFAVSVPILLLSYPIILALPESLAPAAAKECSGSDMTGSDGEREELLETVSNDLSCLSFNYFLALVRPSDECQTVKSVRVTVRTIAVKLYDLLQIPSVRISLALGFLDAFAVQSSALLLQFASKRFGWSLGHATYLLSIRAAVALFLTLGLLPGTTHILTGKLQMRPFRADVSILRMSFAVISVGYCLIASPSKPWQLILGMCCDPSRRILRHT